MQVFPEWSGVRIDKIVRATGGLSWETYFADVRDPSAPERSQRLAVKRAPPRGPLAPYDVTKEASVLSALESSDVPAPRILAHCTDTEVFGRPFAVMEFVAGEGPDLRKIEDWAPWRDEAARLRVADEILRVLAAMQRWDWRQAELPAVAGAPGSAALRIARSVDHYFGNLETHVLPSWPASPMVRHAALWLKENAPDLAEDELVLVHGDFRFGNWLWRGETLAAVHDWERATVGDPMQDLGFLCMPLARQRRPELRGCCCPSTIWRPATKR